MYRASKSPSGVGGGCGNVARYHTVPEKPGLLLDHSSGRWMLLAMGMSGKLVPSAATACTLRTFCTKAGTEVGAGVRVWAWECTSHKPIQPASQQQRKNNQLGLFKARALWQCKSWE